MHALVKKKHTITCAWRASGLGDNVVVLTWSHHLLVLIRTVFEHAL